MAKFDVTPELGEVIRITRTQNNIPSKTLAAHLERSPAYISKLEKGEIRTIEAGELTSILEYITERDSFPEVLEAVTETLVQHYNSREVCYQQLWLRTYDWVARSVSIPPELIQKLHQAYTLTPAKITSLITRINANTELPEIFQNDKAFPYNQWQAGIGGDRLQYIKLKLDPDEIAQVLSGALEETSYVVLYAIVRYLYRMDQYPGEAILTEEEIKKIDQHTEQTLASYGIHTVVYQVWQRRDEVIRKNLSSMLSSQNPEAGSFAEEMVSLISILTRLDLLDGAESLRCLNSSLEWDLAFTARIMRLPLPDLEGVSYTNKKRLLAEIGQLIQKYKDLPPAQKSLESYD